jgi:flagellar basal-body rod modification protein FlgD
MSSGIEGLTATGQQQTQQTQDQLPSADSSGGLTGGIGDSVDKNQFLEILMAQLKNQNPLKPQKSGKFVDQMASLTSLEQMTQMTNSLKSFQKSQQSQQFMTLLGKNVKATTSQGNTVQGEVESVRFTDDGSSVLIGGQDVGTNEIAAISTVDGNEESS